MSLNLHTLKSIKTFKAKKRIGRGLGSGKGAYSTRGVKGQKARTGGRGGLKFKGMRANLASAPKLPGFTSFKEKPATVNISLLEEQFQSGDKVTFDILKKKGLIAGTAIGVKVLGDGKLTKKLTVVVDAVSAGARAAIEAAGGAVKATKRSPKAKKETAA